MFRGFSGTSVVVVNASTGEGEKSIPLPVQGSPVSLYWALAITPAGDRIYAIGSGYTSDSMVAIDTSTLTITATIPGVGGYSLAISPSGDAVYVGTNLAIDVVQTASNTVTGSIPMASVFAITFSPDGTHAYAGSTYQYPGYAVYVIGTSTLAVTSFIPAKFADGGLAVTPDGTLLYAGGASPTFQFSALPGSIINTQSLVSKTAVTLSDYTC